MLALRQEPLDGNMREDAGTDGDIRLQKSTDRPFEGITVVSPGSDQKKRGLNSSPHKITKIIPKMESVEQFNQQDKQMESSNLKTSTGEVTDQKPPKQSAMVSGTTTVVPSAELKNYDSSVKLVDRVGSEENILPVHQVFDDVELAGQNTERNGGGCEPSSDPSRNPNNI